MKVTALQDESLDALCWRYYGSTSGTVEAVMAANPGIAALGVALLAGTVVEMPAPVAIDQVRPLLQLFN
ncbi:tail protein X [Burkholderia gladioli]|uniref:tail protein X n=1 Tax=Burkholderia gladioli TaxID=28095 RepID=UPI00264E988A|nr:tail protein X [Burkholderia gladioli]MDN7497079.1 tail protein X [Burkholderia gladioli]